MFEHLDDSLPPEPTARALGRVLERSGRLRRRRAVFATSAGLTVALVAGLLIGSLAARSPAPAVTDLNPQTGFAAGASVPLSELDDVVFVSDSLGFGLATHGLQTALVRSTDGGDTWDVLQGALPVPYPTQLLFADSAHGYLWGGAPSSDGALPLWVSSDGGRNWSQAPIGPVVSDVSAIGSDVWAVVGSCFVGVTEPASSCPVSLEVSSDDGSTWAPSLSAPPVNESSAVTISDQDVELARMTRAHAYILSFEPNGALGPTASGQLVYTADAGRTWQTRDDPCPEGFRFGEQIAGSGTDDLWLLCASQASAGTQAKALYRSSDGGVDWSLAAAANAPVLSAGVTLPVSGGLPVAGYLSPYSLGHEDLAVLSPSTAWLFPGRAGVFQTSSGGALWQPVRALSTAGLTGGGTGNVVFVDPTHGWVCESGVGLWRTTDAKDWQRLGS